MREAVHAGRRLEVTTLTKQTVDPVADARARLLAAERVVRDLEQKSERLVQRGREIGDQIAALGFKVHAENDRAARSDLDRLSAEAVAHQAETRSLEAATDSLAGGSGLIA
jgi:hypothetical protein